MSEPLGTSVSVLSAQIAELGSFVRDSTRMATAQRDRTEQGVNLLTSAFEEVRTQVHGLAARLESMEITLNRRVEHLEQREMKPVQALPAAQTTVTIGSHNQDAAKTSDETPKPAKWKTYLLLLVTGAAGASGGASLSTPPPEVSAKAVSWAQAIIDAWRSIKGG